MILPRKKKPIERIGGRKEIQLNVEEVYKYTAKGNLVGVISNGTAVLGLGDIGPEGAMPVMEGKAMLFKHFADVDARRQLPIG